MTLAPNTRRTPQFGLTHRLVLARDVAGLDQTALAEALDVSRATISNYENGVTRPSRLQLNAWAVTCDVDPDWLKTGTPDPDTDPSDYMAEVFPLAGRRRPPTRSDKTGPSNRLAA